MKKVGLFIFVAALAMLVGAMPAVAGKKALSEGDLDQITAAGQPEVLITSTSVFAPGATGANFSGGGVISLTVSQDVLLAPAGSVQSGLRALTLNNVLGENLLATVMNIQASPGGSTQTQANIVEQSWGSTIDVSSVSGSTGSIDISGKCVACTNTAGTAGGGTVNVSGKAVASIDQVGSGGGKTLSIHADDILIGGGPITVNQFSDFELSLSQGSQNSVAALVVNNVVAFNLVANALNISSGNIDLAAGLSQSSNVALTQSNLINQYRGTPFKHP